MDPWKLKPARDLGMPLGKRLRSAIREVGLIESVAHVAWGAMVRTYLWLCHRLCVEGRENLPEGRSFIMVANHASHLDALVLSSALTWRMRDRVFPVAADDHFFRTSLATAFAAGVLNALPISRRRTGRQALQELRRKLEQDRCVFLLFPEGTRARDGKMTGFKPGLGMLVASSDVPVVPCYLHGTYEALPPGKWRLRCGKRITLRIGTPRQFGHLANDREGWEKAAAELEAAVRELGGLPCGAPAADTAPPAASDGDRRPASPASQA